MREILETMLRDVEKETAPMRVLYEARKRAILKEHNKRYQQKLVKMNPYSNGFSPKKSVVDLTFSTLKHYWYDDCNSTRINRVFPINTEGYLK